MTGVEYIAKVHREDDALWAEVLDLPGCFASGESLDELREALEEAVKLYLSGDPDVEVGASVPAADRRLEVREMRVSLPA